MTKMPPISSIHLTNVERIPLSMCCIGGLAIVVNFIQCSFNCPFCPWEANLNYRSARIIKLDLDMLLTAIDKYKPEVLFLSGGNFWHFELTKEILSSISRLEIFKGAKLISCSSTNQDIQQMREIAKLCDIVLVEVCECTDVALFLDILETVIKDKHTEVVVVWSANDIRNKVKTVIDELVSRRIYIPINIILHQYGEMLVHQFIDSARKNYALIHLMYSPSSEHSSILCPKCRMPVVIRHGMQVLKILIDESCRCMYCNNKVISAGKVLCKARKIVKTPINIPLI